jgi:hypothetical protein
MCPSGMSDEVCGATPSDCERGLRRLGGNPGAGLRHLPLRASLALQADHVF